MASRNPALLVMPILALGLQAQEPVSRFEFGLGVAAPQALHTKLGLVGELGAQFNRETLAEGRLRVQGVSFGRKVEEDGATHTSSEAATWSLGYDWMPGNDQCRAILGLSGVYWTEGVIPVFGFRTYGNNEKGSALGITLGAQVRISRHLSLEGQYVNVSAFGNILPDKSLNHFAFTVVYR
jgi:hypothetical protein